MNKLHTNRREFVRSFARMGLFAGLVALGAMLFTRRPRVGETVCSNSCQGCGLYDGCAIRMAKGK